MMRTTQTEGDGSIGSLELHLPLFTVLGVIEFLKSPHYD
jgi:hypothetical protein